MDITPPEAHPRRRPQQLGEPIVASKILVLPGSLRNGSFNVALAAAAALELAQLGADVTRISLADYPLPIMDQNLEALEGIPENAMVLGRMIAAQDGIFIASPEYNSSIPPLLKNAIDWVSRIRVDEGRETRPWQGRVVAFGSASDGRFGAARGLYHLRSVMMAVGAEIVTDQCSVSGASHAFDAEGRLTDERVRTALTSTCRSLIRHAAAFGRPGG